MQIDISTLLKSIFFILLTCIGLNLNAQMDIAPIWCFGKNVGLDFSASPPDTFTSSVNTGEGSAGVTDGNGELLFYTDGMLVYNKFHQRMPNGFGLFGSPSSSQSAIVLQHPTQRNSRLFYVITVPEYGGYQGLCYSLVDMNLDGGKGDVVLKNKKLAGVMSEQMQPAMHSNGKDYWIVIKGFENDSLHVFLVDGSGIHLKKGFSMGNKVDNTIGCMRFNSDYSRFAYACYDYSGYLEIFDFNNTTGEISNMIILDGKYDPYGVCFSPDGTKLYVSHLIKKKLMQYDISNYNKTAINATEFQVASGYSFGNMNKAFNGSFYVASPSRYALSRIEFPNRAGAACGFKFDDLSTGKNQCIYGLPLFFDYPVKKVSLEVKGKCIEDSVNFKVNLDEKSEVFLWQLELDNAWVSVSNKTEFNYKLNAPGLVNYRLIQYSDTFKGSINVVKCKKDSIVITSTGNCLEERYFFNVNLTEGKDTFQWRLEKDGRTIDSSYMSQWSYNFKSEGRYILKLISGTGSLERYLDIKQCYGTCTFNVPNVFTPNDDSINRVFKYYSNCPISKVEFVIFNRWGMKLFETNELNKFWDGTYKSELCPDGVYFYMIKYIDEMGKQIELNGTVTLIR